jgi:VCBS repeat-containing protein
MATNTAPAITLEGHLDAVVANDHSNNVSVLIGNGAGGFTAATPAGVGDHPYSEALGDVDGDGDLDALVANAFSSTVSVLMGNGAGGFTAATPVGVGNFPLSVALGDVNGDGHLDALVANVNSNNVSVLLGNGAGGFTAATPVGVGSAPYSVALGDVNGDGHLDALVANRGSNNVSVLLGDGAGDFTAAAPVGAGSGPRSVALGDLNNAQITNEDTPFVFSTANGNALTLSDDAGSNETVTLAAQNGSLTLATQDGLTGVTGDGTHAVTFAGTLAEINAALNGLSYAPDGNFNGRDTLTITANDNADAAAGGPLTATKLVPIIVNAVNDPAVLSADVRNLTETNAAADISSSGTLTVSDVDSPATFVAQGGTAGLYGTFAITSGGAWTYTASSAHNEFVAGTTYTDTFSVASADGTPTSVTIHILGTNDPAVISADVRNLTETNAASAISSSGTLTISDVDSPATFVAQAGTVGLYGTFAITSAGAWTYTASSAHNEFVAGTTYTDTFAVASADGTSTSVTIHILGTDDAPVAQGDAYTLAVDAPLDVAAPGVLANDTDPDSALGAHLIDGPMHAASFIFHADGSFEYMPEPTFFGDDTFTYRASAGGHDSSDVVDTIHVTRPLATVETTDSNGNTTTTTYDSKGDQPWSTQSFTVDDAGHTTDTTVTYRDGTVQGSVFDTTGQPWSQQNFIRDAQDHVTNSSVFYDDGTVQAAIFDTDGQPWSQQNFVVDAQGHMTNSSVFYDDGTVQGTTYDTTGQPWSQQNFALNAQGQVTNYSVLYDDGTVQSSVFDTTGQPWSQQNFVFNAQGQETNYSVLYDDGTVQGRHLDSSTLFDLMI